MQTRGSVTSDSAVERQARGLSLQEKNTFFGFRIGRCCVGRRGSNGREPSCQLLTSMSLLKFGYFKLAAKVKVCREDETSITCVAKVCSETGKRAMRCAHMYKA